MKCFFLRQVRLNCLLICVNQTHHSHPVHPTSAKSWLSMTGLNSLLIPFFIFALCKLIPKLKISLQCFLSFVLLLYNFNFEFHLKWTWTGWVKVHQGQRSKPCFFSFSAVIETCFQIFNSNIKWKSYVKPLPLQSDSLQLKCINLTFTFYMPN